MTASRLVRRAQRCTALALAACLTSVTLLPVAHAGMIGTPAVAQSMVAADSPQARLLATLDRTDVVQALAQRGVNAQDARDRVAALSDDQAQALLAQIDSAPAGADGIIGTIVFIFLVLLVTDILGFTKVFPFTRSIR